MLTPKGRGAHGGGVLAGASAGRALLLLPLALAAFALALQVRGKVEGGGWSVHGGRGDHAGPREGGQDGAPGLRARCSFSLAPVSPRAGSMQTWPGNVAHDRAVAAFGRVVVVVVVVGGALRADARFFFVWLVGSLHPPSPPPPPRALSQWSTPSDKGLADSIALAGGVEPR